MENSEQVEYNLVYNSYEYKEGIKSVKGRLKNHVNFWKTELKPTELVLNTIEHGYVIPFFQEPVSAFLKNNRSAIDNSGFVAKAISELLISGCIIETTYVPYVVNPLTVAISDSGKERLVLDLRHVNRYIEKQKVKFEGVTEAKQYAKQGNYAIKFDLKSGYHHLDIHPQHQKFLGFSWNFDGVQRYFIFTVLPFGIASASHIFTKVLRTLVNYWRALSYPVIVYLDDGWACDNLERCQIMSDSILNTLLSAGFLPNYDKSIFTPVQSLEWLGFTWNLKDGVLEVPLKKLVKTRDKISSVLRDKSTTARILAGVVGKIISLIPALGSVCQLMTRNTCIATCERETWDAKFEYSILVRNELNFWLTNCVSMPFKLISPIQCKPERIVFSDASAYAGAGFIELNGKHTVVHSMWKFEETSKSSTWREMKAIFIVLQSLCLCLSNKLVKIYTDNQNVVRICNVGSMKPDLQTLALQIYQLCIRYSIVIELEWIPRDLNFVADYYSKLFDFDDWSISQHMFNFFNQKWGPFSVDRFADSNNNKLDNFNSRFWTPGSKGVDAFAFDWCEDNNWLVPPIHLVCRVLNHLRICKGKGVIIVPLWRSALFWPLLWNCDEKKFNYFVVDSLEFQKPKNFFVAGSDKNSIFAQSPFVSNVLALKLDFSV